MLIISACYCFCVCRLMLMLMSFHFVVLHRTAKKCTKISDARLRALLFWPGLFKGWVMWFVLLTLIRWIAIYPLDSVIQPLNNRGLLIKPYFVSDVFLIVHVRYINIQAWLRGFRVKIANFSSFFCLSIPKRDLDTKKTTPNIEV